MTHFNIDENQELKLVNGQWVLFVKGEPQNSRPQYLYKYYPLNEYSLDGLENGYFYLCNPRYFNDPFDCNRNLIIENQKDLNDWDYVQLLNDINNKGISCFSERGMHPLMWGHYTNSYNGFVIKIKFNFQFSESIDFQAVQLLNVIYSNNPNSVPKNAPFSPQYQLMVKLKDWHYEKEWRLIVHKQNPEVDKLYYDSAAIEEIYIGYKTYHDNGDQQMALRRKFEKIIKSKFSDTPLFSVGPDQKKLELKKMPFRYGTINDIFPDLNL